MTAWRKKRCHCKNTNCFFEVMDKCEAWSIQLLRIKTSKVKGTEYAAMSVNITPQGKISKYCRRNIKNILLMLRRVN